LLTEICPCLDLRSGATNSATNQKLDPHKSMYFQYLTRLIEAGIAALRGATKLLIILMFLVFGSYCSAELQQTTQQTDHLKLLILATPVGEMLFRGQAIFTLLNTD
jgi:hypothetical protein